MALYDGVNGVARKVTKKYDGVGGVARKVKKAYASVNGVARQYFSSDVTYSGIKSVEVINQNYYNIATPNPSWGAYVGGYDNVLQYNRLEAYFYLFHAACFAMHDYVNQQATVHVDIVTDDNGKITGFESIRAWVDPQCEEDMEWTETEVAVLNGDTAFADGYLDVKMICISSCCDATVRITFE